jgi:hypothetical protein
LQFADTLEAIQSYRNFLRWIASPSGGFGSREIRSFHAEGVTFEAALRSQ